MGNRVEKDKEERSTTGLSTGEEAEVSVLPESAPQPAAMRSWERKGEKTTMELALENADEKEVEEEIQSILANANGKINPLQQFIILYKGVLEISKEDNKGLKLKAYSEGRRLMLAFVEVIKELNDIEAVQEFQKTVLEVIGEVAPDVRDRIIRKLAEKRAIRSVIGFDRS